MKTIVCSILLVFFWVSATATHAGTSNNDEPVLVGAILPLSGEVAWMGSAMSDGIRMALAEGASKVMTVVFDDDQSVEKIPTISAANKLLNGGAKVLFVTAVNSGAAISSVVDKNSTLVLVLQDSNKTILKMSKNIFGFGFSNEKVGHDMAEFAVRNSVASRVAIVSARDEWSEVVADAFKERLIEKGGHVLVHEKVLLDDSDFRTLIARLKAKNVESVYFPLYKGSIVSFIKQAREGRLAAQLLTAEGLSEAEIKQLGEHAESIYLTNVWFDNPPFRQRYEKFTGKSSKDVNLGHVAIGYDAVKFIEKVIVLSKAKGITLHDALPSVEVNGELGATRFHEGRLSDRSQSIVVVKNGEFQLVSTLSNSDGVP